MTTMSKTFNPITALRFCNTANSIDLINYIRANPTFRTVDDLALTFLDVAQKNPTNVGNIANVILAVRDMLDPPVIPSIIISGKLSYASLDEMLSDCIYEMLTLSFSDDEDPLIHRNNPLLVSAMVSGACARSDLCHSVAQAGMVTYGLQFSRSEYESYFTPVFYEVNILHACLQLLVGGSLMYRSGQMRHEQDEVLPALISIAEKGFVKDPNGKKLLQVTIDQARIGFMNDLPIPEIWHILFPAVK